MSFYICFTDKLVDADQFLTKSHSIYLNAQEVQSLGLLQDKSDESLRGIGDHQKDMNTMLLANIPNGGIISEAVVIEGGDIIENFDFDENLGSSNPMTI